MDIVQEMRARHIDPLDREVEDLQRRFRIAAGLQRASAELSRARVVLVLVFVLAGLGGFLTGLAVGKLT